MNKLYIIRWLIADDFVISVCSFWTRSAMLDKMRKNPEWTFSQVENNCVHEIWIAK